jgi:hypothetical protein
MSCKSKHDPFDQMYDSFCAFDAERITFRGGKILGFTGRDESARSRRNSGSSGFGFCSPISSASYYTEYFDRWLVLEFADGRLACIPPVAIRYIEQATSQGK